MRLKIVHIVSNLSQINFGVWNAAIFGADYLKDQHAVLTSLWICTQPVQHNIRDMDVVFLGNAGLTQTLLRRVTLENGHSPDNTIFVSHGAWLRPTAYAYYLQRSGFKWIYVPHGMLEPWCMRQGILKKLLYYFFNEQRFNKNAMRVRAVSAVEQRNLETKLKRPVALVENGVRVPQFAQKNQEEIIFLFMARLHFKKGILPLVKAWQQVMGNEAGRTLIIAGPDDGELKNIKPFLSGNARYVGAVYAEDKIMLLRKAHYYLLPSFSEGFPTSVLEAMSYGMIPLISEGCNFNAVFNSGLGYQIEPGRNQIAEVLLKLKEMTFDASLSLRNHEFIRTHYSEECIGRKLFDLYSELTTVKEPLTADAKIL